MVNENGQLYTIEGIAASVLIMTTVYLVLSSTIVLTPAETHIYNMQLEQLGNDVLAVMDLPSTWVEGGEPYPKSPLETYVEQNQPDYFIANFTRYLNATTENRIDDLECDATIFFRGDGDTVQSIHFANTGDYFRQNAVKVYRWVNINNDIAKPYYRPEMRPGNQTVLLEVLLWRG